VPELNAQSDLQKMEIEMGAANTKGFKKELI